MGRRKGDGDARERLLAAAGRGFRLGGFGGAGVDGIAGEAGLTSGAFYAQFGSKAEAFRLALADGLAFLRHGVETFRARFGAGWLPPFVDFYLGERMRTGLEEACALPTFTADAARADPATRAVYEAELRHVAAVLAEGLPGPNAEARAWALLAVLAGGTGMARAVADDGLKQKILAAVQETAARL